MKSYWLSGQLIKTIKAHLPSAGSEKKFAEEPGTSFSRNDGLHVRHDNLKSSCKKRFYDPVRLFAVRDEAFLTGQRDL